ncbi:LOW QUALITY PROTEIN: uncharacterized protein LOC111077190 [Drosophila obscura]|uniref:LOW QUALITY PROTEIN: uncharacterized protein LOC111077190 n=1 Tax=Drosophila obscura TaxID=7282 RepID=UPI001BB0D9D1|nr:LOW QUALITY PROTEIN: uncharacterized protein LOC111077190 [Drosophila obscura]
MLPFTEENVPELLLQRSSIAFCSNLHLGRGRGRTVSSLVLGRNLKFYEFRKKELLHHIDLKESRLKQLAAKLQAYDGPMSSFLRREDETVSSHGKESLPSVNHSKLLSAEELPIGIGKFVWLQEQIYILVHCWQLLLVLRRLPEHGANFELVAQHDHVADFKMVDGPIKYQAYVELRFTNGKRQRTDFQPAQLKEESSSRSSTAAADTFPNQNFERLLQQVHTAQAELCSQRAQTQLDFARTLELQTFGPPGHRSLLLEEKQLLRRFGDVWTRVCGDFVVCGTLLANIAGNNRLSIVHCLRPLIHLDNGGSSLSYEHRLYELPVEPNGQPPEDYDELAQFWSCQEQHSRRLNWRPVAKASQLLPDCTAVLLVRLQLEDLLQAEKLQLLAIYEIRNGTEDSGNSMRQMHLATIDVGPLLHQTEALAPRFAPATLHQDFLAVIMSQTAHCALRLKFIEGQAAQDCARFEQLLVSKLQFELITAQGTDQASSDRGSDVDMLDAFCTTTTTTNTALNPVQHIFYNSQPLSQWCGVLLLRDDPGQHWHVYAQTQARLRLLLHRLLHDLLQLHCNLSVLELSEYNTAPADVAGALEASLREELLAWSQLLKPQEGREQQKTDRLKQLTHLHQLQMASDVLASVIKSQEQEDE